MQKVRNVNDWQKIEDGHAVNFEKREARSVRLEVNAPQAVTVDYADPDGLVVFLGRVVGRDVIEFTTPGEFSLIVNGGELWFHTVDGERIAFPPSTSPKFTKLIERRARNPELERMQMLMQQNMRRALDAQSRQMAALLDQRLRAGAAPAKEPAAAGDGGGPVGKQESDVKSADGAGDSGSDDGNASGGKAKK